MCFILITVTEILPEDVNEIGGIRFIWVCWLVGGGGGLDGLVEQMGLF
jgi:hypothetical protein